MGFCRVSGPSSTDQLFDCAPASFPVQKIKHGKVVGDILKVYLLAGKHLLPYIDDAVLAPFGANHLLKTDDQHLKG
jgi:hypothetical protein